VLIIGTILFKIYGIVVLQGHCKAEWTEKKIKSLQDKCNEIERKML